MGFNFWRESGQSVLHRVAVLTVALLVVLVSFGGTAQEETVEGPMGDYGDAPDGVFRRV